MTQGSAPEQEPDRNPLDYQTPQKKAKAPIGRAVAGAFFGMISVLLAVYLAFGLMEWTRLPIFIGAPAMLAGFLGLLLLAQSFGKTLPIEERQRRRRFYIVGFIIGCGIGALLEGLCFAAIGKI